MHSKFLRKESQVFFITPSEEMDMYIEIENTNPYFFGTPCKFIYIT